MSLKAITESAIELLEALIATPSFSGEEERTAELISDWLTDHGVKIRRSKNSVIAENNFSDPSKPYLLLNSHHDTVKPNNAYVKDPFKPEHSEGKLFGLGSNDAGGALVSLLATFVHFYDRDDLPFNLLMVASAEEETAGPNSLRGLLAELPPIELAIVGEPTQMQLAIAEKGLMVYD
ncbi:MAG: M20/M25/M40 family metallo-hydrolase, partial [Bacteroidetes bacterium]|nr:M20/M25/M40 family metallo-hydrolase [Bacteroidota bacterium]